MASYTTPAALAALSALQNTSSPSPFLFLTPTPYSDALKAAALLPPPSSPASSSTASSSAAAASSSVTGRNLHENLTADLLTRMRITYQQHCLLAHQQWAQGLATTAAASGFKDSSVASSSSSSSSSSYFSIHNLLSKPSSKRVQPYPTVYKPKILTHNL